MAEKKATVTAAQPDLQETATSWPLAAPVSDPQAEAEKILAAARAEAEKILQEAKKKAESGSDGKDAKNQAAPSGPKFVKIKLFKDNDKYKDDVFVAVNGRSYQIKRGEDVEVPDFVAEVLERSMKQDAATANLIESESSRYRQEAESRNL